VNHFTCARRQVSAEVDAWLEQYEPRSWGSDLWHEQLREFVIPAVGRLAPATPSSAGEIARALIRISVWSLSQGTALAWDQILDPDTVERFVSVGITDDRCRATYRALLRRLGPLLTSKAPWEPRPEAVSRRHLAPPYCPEELEALWQDAQHQSTPVRLRAGRALIALGAGAGLDGRWVTRVTAGDVIRRDGVVLVRVGEPVAREVPVLARWELEVLRLAATAEDQFLVGGHSLSRNRAGFLACKFQVAHGHPPLSGPRLRSTWLGHHLTIGTRLPELAKAAGLVGVTVLSDLLAEVPALDPQQAARMLRGLA
jgi:hypothetical protein